jgi:predicted transcriptional regulator
MSDHRTLYIGIASLETVKAKTIAIARGEKPHPNEPKHWVSSLEELGSILSNKNMLLLEMIRNSKPDSIESLAELAGDDTAQIEQRLRSMEKIGFLELRESDCKLTPRVLYDRYAIQGWLAA